MSEERDETQVVEEETAAESPVETEQPLSPEETIAAYERKEKELQEASIELRQLEDTMSNLKEEVKSCKDRISALRLKVDCLIGYDVAGFLRYEQEKCSKSSGDQSWRSLPVEQLDVTDNDKEHLLEHFEFCGELADWLGKDYADKKPGISGEKTKDRLRDAINKISGNTEKKEESDDE